MAFLSTTDKEDLIVSMSALVCADAGVDMSAGASRTRALFSRGSRRLGLCAPRRASARARERSIPLADRDVRALAPFTDNLQAVIKASGNKVAPHWVPLFAKAIEKAGGAEKLD